MARKLKTYVTSQGFFEEAVAAPSMRAALKAWGSTHNLFHQGFAKETDDPAIVAATMKAPGVTLKRPVGSAGAFKKHADLPRSIPAERPDDTSSTRKERASEKPTSTVRNKDLKRDRGAAKAFEQEEKRREKQRRKEEALRKKRAEKRDASVAEAKAALQESEKRYEKSLAMLKTQQAAINEKIEAADAKWDKERKKLESAIRKAQE